jgi:uncharacterized membrane protein
VKELSKFARFSEFNGKRRPIVSIVLASIFVSIILVGYYFLVLDAPPEGFSSIYLLDEQKKTESYPEFLIIGENNTFNVWVGVVNHMGMKQTYEIQQKITQEPILIFPINEEVENKFSKILDDQETWETMISTTISDPGNYSLVFELYLKEEGETVEVNTEPDNYVLLNIEVDIKNQD